MHTYNKVFSLTPWFDVIHIIYKTTKVYIDSTAERMSTRTLKTREIRDLHAIQREDAVWMDGRTEGWT